MILQKKLQDYMVMTILTQSQPERQLAVSEALWTTLTLAYKSPDDRSKNPVALPAGEALGAILSCAASLIAQVPDARTRHNLIKQATPMIDIAVNNDMRRSDSSLPSHQSIILSN